MSPDQPSKALLVGLGGKQAGDAIGNFFPLGSIGQNRLALEGEDLSGMGEVDLFGFDRGGNDPAAFKAPVGFADASLLLGKKAMMAAVAGPWPRGGAGCL